MNGKSRYSAEFSQLPTTDADEYPERTTFDESRDIEEELLHGQIAMPTESRGSDNQLDILIAQVGYGSFQKKLLVNWPADLIPMQIAGLGWVWLFVTNRLPILLIGSLWIWLAG
jgi:hypothetical protein